MRTLKWRLVGTSIILSFCWLIGLATSDTSPPNVPDVDRAYLIRVGLTRGASGAVIWIRSATGFRWMNPESGRAVGEGKPGEVWGVQFQDGLFIAQAGEREIKQARLVAEPNGDQPLEVGAAADHLRAYRGSLEWTVEGDRLITVNWLRLGDYLKAVVPSEMPANFHEEALKAQVVAVRSYTLRRLNRHRESGFDLCDHEHCQRYPGVAAERPATSAAVETTASEILTFNGQPAETVFSADCGGHTAPNVVAGIGRNPAPYLQGVPDWDEKGQPFCAASPRHTWALNLNADVLAQAFDLAGTVRRLKVVERTPAGHAEKIQIEGEQRTLEITGAEFRGRLGGTRVKSLLFSVEQNGEGWVLHGQGAGHGVGFCQWGAQGRALAGQTYRQILETYFPGTRLSGGKRIGVGEWERGE